MQAFRVIVELSFERAIFLKAELDVVLVTITLTVRLFPLVTVKRE